jgi:hypothetical protein
MLEEDNKQGLYEIKYVLADKSRMNGTAMRGKSAGVMHLTTPRGVKAFIEEQKPFAEITVFDMLNHVDVTERYVTKEKKA